MLHYSKATNKELVSWQKYLYDPSMLIWINESGCDRRHSRRKRAYSLRGITPVDHRLLIRGTRYSAIPVMSTQGIHDICLVEGSVNGEVFESFVRNHLLPVLQPFNWVNPLSVVVMDNASIHHVEGVRQLIEDQAGARLPYSCSAPIANLAGYVTGCPLCNGATDCVTGRPDDQPTIH